jgi:hypothetical protein
MASVNENGMKYVEMAPRISVHESTVAMWLAQGIFLFAIIVTRKGWGNFEYIDVYRTRIDPCCIKDYFSCINIDLIHETKNQRSKQSSENIFRNFRAIATNLAMR